MPVFVLTHYARNPVDMKGGTTFHFITNGIHAAMDLAKKAAGDRDVRIGGGADTVRQYLQAGLVDEVHFALTPTLLGQGEALLSGINLTALGFTCTEHVASRHEARYPVEITWRAATGTSSVCQVEGSLDRLNPPSMSAIPLAMR